MKFLILTLLLLCSLELLHCSVISAENYTVFEISNSSIPTETSFAVCKISTSDNNEITANATMTRKLEGTCSAKEISFELSNFEKRILNQLENLRTFLMKMTNHIKTPELQLKMNNHQMLQLLHFEISTLNNTILDNGMKTYIYYWEIENINTFIKSKKKLAIDSSSFTVAGKKLWARLISSSTTDIIEFFITSDYLYTLKHRLTIMDQTNKNLHITSKMLSSTCLRTVNSNHCNGFKIKYSMLKAVNYMSNNNLIVKINIYLD